MNIVCVVGARPNFVKAAPVIEALRRQQGFHAMLVHTGQHYDRQMSTLLFEELGMPRPDLDLQVGSGSHGAQTGQILIRLEPVLARDRPDLVVVFGDVNSTLAAALCAAKLQIPVGHVEAGLRSFDRTMPEELNRVLTDQLSDYLFVTEPSGVTNLLREGISKEKIHFVGNTMVDTLLKHCHYARGLRAWERFGLRPRSYGLLTLHRSSNVDDPRTLREILSAVCEISSQLPLLFPCHPRTRLQLATQDLHEVSVGIQGRRDGRPGGMQVVEPLGYLQFISLMTEARLVLTDSGGIQEETTVLGVPCLTLRENTERPITIEQGTNRLAGKSQASIRAAVESVLEDGAPARSLPHLWDGCSADRIAAILATDLAHARSAR